jgi:RecA-family ATPase
MDNDKVVRFPVRLKRYRFREENTIDLRPWIMRQMLLRGHVTALLAAGGVGKSILGLTIGLHLCAGKSFGPFKAVPNKNDPEGRYSVAVLSVEEDEAELDRRLHAIRRQFNFDNNDAARLFTVSTADLPILAHADPRGHVKATDLAQQLETLLFREGIDVVIIDPFIEVWNGLENDNAQVKAAAGIIRNMCRRLNAACLLMHHVKKGGVTPGDIDSGRGASSLAGLVRIGHTITNMTAEEANTFNLPSKNGLIRIDAAKGNYLPSAEVAYWFEHKTITLDNADAEQKLPGDGVGVLVPWTPPGLFDGMTYEIIDAILETIAAGIDNGAELFTFAPQSKDRFVGAAITQHMENCAPERAGRIIKIWKDSGLLYEKDYMSFATRRQRKGVAVDVTKRPSATTETV